MAHENIEIAQSNFCLGPQSGTICTIDTTNPQTVLRIKDTGGSTITTLNLSTNIIGELLGVEYVGPTNLTGLVDGLIFFTVEKVNTTSCMIRRWETRTTFSELNLKEQVIKSNSGHYRYNLSAFAVEYYHRSFSMPNAYYSYLDMDDTSNIGTGTKLILGPSSDADNLGATETATVSHLASYIGGIRVYLTAPLTYQYRADDQITFYSHVYLNSIDGYAGDPDKGSLYKFNAYSWSSAGVNNKALYKKVTVAKWCPQVAAVASIVGTNMLFVRPYDSYLNWRSMFLNNVADDNNTVFPVYDVIFDGQSIYKLQDKITLREDNGSKNTYNWSSYNYQADTLSPYTNSINLWMEQSIVTGYEKNVDLNVKVRDQYHVALRDVNVNLYKSGDGGALFDPLNGQATTDVNGEATIIYRSGTTYTGHTEITARADRSSSSTGSQYVWTSNNVISFPSANPITNLLFQKKEISGDLVNLKQITENYMWPSDDGGGGVDWNLPSISLFGKSYFTTPGGHWGPAGTAGFCAPTVVETWLPELYAGSAEDQLDAPRAPNPFNNWPYPPSLSGDFPIPNQIRLVEDFTSEGMIKSLTDFLVYDDSPGPGGGDPPSTIIFQPDETGSLTFSQLNLAHHTHWVDGVAQDELWTYVNIDQFIFVEDAIPVFWSDKNPVDTNIWLRLRPFAFSLDSTTFRMWVRESSYYGDTGYYEVTSLVQLTPFDAGAGVIGLEVLYDPPQDFYHNSIVFVRLEVYDLAASPNYIYTDYWFNIIPDYKAPYLDNLSPSRQQDLVDVNTQIYFEIKDVGTGIDIDSLECLLNSRLVDASGLNIEKVSRYHYKVTYTPPQALYYNKQYKVTVKVNDSSENANRMNDSYYFYTAPSEGIEFTDFDPAFCKHGIKRFDNVSLVALATGYGIDRDTIKLQVFDKDVNPNITPIVYRIS
jgi:hypothetical protein